MRTGSKKNSRSVKWLAFLSLPLCILACNLPFLADRSSPDPGTGAAAPGLIQPSSLPPASESEPDVIENNTCLPSIIPGKTSRSEVISSLGEPSQVQQEGGFENLYYPSPIKGQFNQVSLNNQVVEQVVVIQGEEPPQRWSDVQSRHGIPAHTAYSDYLQGSRVFAYPELGLSYTADSDMDVVFFRVCFVPLSLEDYISRYGAVLLQEDPFTR
jgi:hypothetical protein